MKKTLKNDSKVIALTGNIGSGKSSAAWIFEELGVPVIYSDKIAHKAISPGTHIWESLFKRFGTSILLEDKIIDRNALGKILFADEAERKLVESWIHPVVKDHIDHEVASLAKNGKHLILVEIPLLFEAGWEDLFDIIVLVRCNDELQLKRTMKKFNISEADAKRELRLKFLFK